MTCNIMGTALQSQFNQCTRVGGTWFCQVHLRRCATCTTQQVQILGTNRECHWCSRAIFLRFLITTSNVKTPLAPAWLLSTFQKTKKGQERSAGERWGDSLTLCSAKTPPHQRDDLHQTAAANQWAKNSGANYVLIAREDGKRGNKRGSVRAGW